MCVGVLLEGLVCVLNNLGVVLISYGLVAGLLNSLLGLFVFR